MEQVKCHRWYQFYDKNLKRMKTPIIHNVCEYTFENATLAQLNEVATQHDLLATDIEVGAGPVDQSISLTWKHRPGIDPNQLWDTRARKMIEI